jgi:hypothetical protein
VILFLDFDGVLHRHGCWRDQHFEHLPNLEQVLRDVPAVQVVISSTWRHAESLDRLRERFSSDLRHRIIGVTPSWRDLGISHGAARQRECEAWMASQVQDAREATRWLAVDDSAHYFDPGCRNLFLLVPDDRGVTGLDVVRAERLRARLVAELAVVVGSSPACARYAVRRHLGAGPSVGARQRSGHGCARAGGLRRAFVTSHCGAPGSQTSAT